jgi:transposase-like protein
MNNNNLMSDLLAIAGNVERSGLGRLLECLLNGLMQIQRQEHLGAGPYERTEGPKGYANGCKERTFYSVCGPIELQIPQVRNGDFYPGYLEKGLRSDRALKASLAEMYIQCQATSRSSPPASIRDYQGTMWA